MPSGAFVERGGRKYTGYRRTHTPRSALEYLTYKEGA